MPYTILSYSLIFIIGIFVGSFLNICIYRLPQEKSVFKNAPYCQQCEAHIKLFDLIPIFSWFILKGRCRACNEKFSIRYPAVELITGLLWILVFNALGFNLIAILIALLFSTLIVIFLMDWDTQLISIAAVNFIGLLSIANIIFVHEHKIYDYLLGAIIVSLPLLLIHIFSRGLAMGLGDVYLMAGAGLFLGIKGVTVAIFIGLFLGSICGLIIKYVTKSSRFAFGPYLSV